MNGFNIFKCVGKWKCQPLLSEGRLVWKESPVEAGLFFSPSGPDQRQGRTVMRSYLITALGDSIILSMRSTLKPKGIIKLAIWSVTNKATISEDGEHLRLSFPESHIVYYGSKMRFDVDIDIETLAKLGWRLRTGLIRVQ